MRKKRYSKDMKGTQEVEKERYIGGIIKMIDLAKEEENKEEAEKMLKEVFAEKGLK